MKTFEVRVRRYDRKEGVSNWCVQKTDASNMAAAIGASVREFFKGLTTKEKRDAAKSVEVKCVYMGKSE
jgi:predicted component of type VI protein secretion system